MRTTRQASLRPASSFCKNEQIVKNEQIDQIDGDVSHATSIAMSAGLGAGGDGGLGGGGDGGLGDGGVGDGGRGVDAYVIMPFSCKHC
jgi:hypothetical protein